MSLGADTITVLSDLFGMSDILQFKTFTAPALVKVVRVGVIFSAGPSGDDLVLTFSHRLANGGTLTGGEPDITVSIPESAAGGEVWYRDAEDFPATPRLGHGAPQVYIPGEALRVTTDGAPTTCFGFVFVEAFVSSFQDVSFVRSDPTRIVTAPNLDSTTLANLTDVIPV